MAKSKYHFDEDYQLAIIALQLRDQVFLSEYMDVLDPHYFTLDYYVSLARIIKEFFERVQKIPTKEELYEEVSDYCRRYSIDNQTREYIFTTIDDVFSIRLPDKQSVTDRIVEFGQSHAIRQAVMETAELLDTGKSLDNVPQLFSRALTVGHNVSDLGTNFVANLEGLPQWLKNERSYKTGERIPTFFDGLDRATYGGPLRGEICVVIAVPGGGKSSWLIDKGAVSMRRGLGVVHYTIGDLYELDVMLRYSGRLLKIPMDRIIEATDKFRDRVEGVMRTNPQLRIKEFMPGEVTVNHIRAHLSRLAVVERFVPDMIIVDYPDNFRMTTDNVYKEMGDIYNKLRTLGKEYNAVVWVGCQANRHVDPNNPKFVLDKYTVSESYKKSFNADMILSLNQTRKEYDAGLGRVWLDKVRRGRGNILIPFAVDYARMYYWETDWEDYRETMEGYEDTDMTTVKTDKDGKRPKKNRSARDR